MGVDPHRGVEPLMARDDAKGALRRAHVPARDQDPLDARQPGTTQHEVEVVVEAVRVDVAVGVDEARHRRTD